MVRIRLLASCLADPTGIKFRGHEVDVTEEHAVILLATNQWERVAPPDPPQPEPAAVEDGEWTGEPGTAAAAKKAKREFRGKRP